MANNTNTFKDKETAKLQLILNLPEIRSGRFALPVTQSSLSQFKTGRTDNINKDIFLILKIKVNELYLLLKKFTSKEVSFTDSYFKELLDIADTPVLNWVHIYKSVDAIDKPNVGVLRWSYYKSEREFPVYPSGEFIKRFEPFFEQLRFELKLLSTKIKM